METELERLEVERAVACDDDLAVEDGALRELGEERRHQLRVVADERLAVAALDGRRRRHP